jgi:predicted nucleic acid-binding protein
VSKESVYIETSIVSYLVAKPSRDLLIAARQQLTAAWWEDRRAEFELFISPVVLDECGRGDQLYAAKRLALLVEIPLLDVSPEAISLGHELIRQHALPVKAAQDALHIAVAAVHRLNYLLTWNCKHMANVQLRRGIERTCQAGGYQAPLLCTPNELSGDSIERESDEKE